MAKRLKATNTTTTLQPQNVDPLNPELDLEQNPDLIGNVEFNPVPNGIMTLEIPTTDAPPIELEPHEYSPYYVTRAEWNNLIERILHFNGRSPQKL